MMAWLQNTFFFHIDNNNRKERAVFPSAIPVTTKHE